MNALHIPFGDLARQAQQLAPELTEALTRVALGGWYVLGEEVRAFEEDFAALCGANSCVGVASGFEALYLALAALEIGPGDEVITVANACIYQAAAILQVGARPVFVDVDPQTHNLDPNLLEMAITPHTRAIMPVHLYGRMAPMPAICAIARAHGLAVIEDAAQAHGAWLQQDDRIWRAGAVGDLACFSFYPSKNLGALGDAGAVTTNSPELAERLRQLRMYGWGEKYVTSLPGGRNSRLDAIQAAALRTKLPHLQAWNGARAERAAWYRELLAGLPLQLPVDEAGHVYHLFVIMSERRDELQRQLLAQGIGSDIHYPLPTHLQPAYQHLGYQRGALPVTEALTSRILSLPLYPELSRSEVETVAAAIHRATYYP